ncbi:visual pigment-like receptor peropsin [Tubulanus polymorphus]|uniref:visual pigment-like receptor peropsin n=1 Tax=Tubulanus polymorphus TaxID=672921 RepID=UPI003DA2829B
MAEIKTSVFGVIFNVLVLIAMVQTTLLRNRPMNTFVMNLAAADALQCVLAFPMVIMACFETQWNFSSAFCAWYGFVSFLVGNVSMSILVVISLDRYVRVWRPFSVLCVDARMSKIVCAVVWCYGLLWSSFPLFGWSKYELEPHRLSCSVDWSSRDPLNRSFIITLFVFVFLIPLCIMVYCYVGVVMWFRRKCTRPSNRGQELKAYLRMTTMAAVMVSAFMICWTPYAIVSFMGTFGYKTPPDSAMWFVLAPVLAKTSVAVNPLIYFATNPNIRQAVSSLFKHRRHMRNSAGAYLSQFSSDSFLRGRIKNSSNRLKTVNPNFVAHRNANNRTIYADFLAPMPLNIAIDPESRDHHGDDQRQCEVEI